MDIDSRIELIKQVGEEIITEEDLRTLLQTKDKPLAYDGFEPSGRMHIAQGLLRALNVNRMLKAGCKVNMLIADWHAWINKKYGGDLSKIETAGKLMVETFKASGMDVDNVNFVYAKELVNDGEYWKKVVQISQHTTIQRMQRCSTIMGRQEGEMTQTGQLLYPAMQCADIFHMNVDICQLGMDQRKVNILAREIGPKLGWYSPVAVHHHMLLGLSKPKGDDILSKKMSKSNPDSAIFMDDAVSEVERKLSKAFCPEKQVEDNPVLEYCKYIIMPMSEGLMLQRKFGGEIEYVDYSALEQDYRDGKVHPLDLKNAVAFHLNKLLEPIREHFSKGKAQELLKEVRKFAITR